MSFVERYGWTWPSVRDPQRRRARSLGAEYQPHVILIDADGGIVDSWQGGGDVEVWKQMIAKVP